MLQRFRDERITWRATSDDVSLLLLLLLMVLPRRSEVVELCLGDGFVVALREDTTLVVEVAPVFGLGLDAHLTRREESLSFRIDLEVAVPEFRLEFFSLEENFSVDEGEVGRRGRGTFEELELVEGFWDVFFRDGGDEVRRR